MFAVSTDWKWLLHDFHSIANFPRAALVIFRFLSLAEVSSPFVMEIENHNKASFALFLSCSKSNPPCNIIFPSPWRWRGKSIKGAEKKILRLKSSWKIRLEDCGICWNKFGNYEDFNRPGIFLSYAIQHFFHIDDLKEGFIHSSLNFVK